MKINFNKQYTTIAIYALLVILCGILCVFTFTHFGEVWANIIDFLNIFMPIFYGMAISYIVYPGVRFFERKVLVLYEKPFPELQEKQTVKYVTQGNVLISYEIQE